MKKLFMLICLLAVLVSASAIVNLVRVTVVNRSGYEVSIWLASDGAPTYYLAIPIGDREDPATKVYTLLPGSYEMTTVYSRDGVEQIKITEDINLVRNTKIIPVPLQRSGVLQCEDLYRANSRDLKNCLDGLRGILPVDDGMYKVLPSLWLARLRY